VEVILIPCSRSFATRHWHRRKLKVPGVCVLLGFAALVVSANSDFSASDPTTRPPNVARVSENYGKLPLAFEANRGQTDRQVKFLSRGRGYGLFLTSTEAVLSLQKSGVRSQESEVDSRLRGNDGARTKDKGQRTTDNGRQITDSVLRMRLLNANPRANVTGLDELPGKSNYFIGNDPKKWRTDVPNFAKVQYKDVYPGVDLIYYGNQRQLEYDWVVRPGADPSVIRLALDVAGKVGSRQEAEGGQFDCILLPALCFLPASHLAQ